MFSSLPVHFVFIKFEHSICIFQIWFGLYLPVCRTSRVGGGRTLKVAMSTTEQSGELKHTQSLNYNSDLPSLGFEGLSRKSITLTLKRTLYCMFYFLFSIQTPKATLQFCLRPLPFQRSWHFMRIEVLSHPTTRQCTPKGWNKPDRTHSTHHARGQTPLRPAISVQKGFPLVTSSPLPAAVTS